MRDTAFGSGLLVAAYGRRGLLETEDGETVPCLIRGRRLRAVCGDRVKWRAADTGATPVVEVVEPRRNALRRASPRGSGVEILAANLSCLVVVLAAEPAVDLFLADRYLCAAALMGCRPLLAWNKTDIGPAAPGEVVAYQDLGYRLCRLSASTAEGLAALATELAGEVTILVGQSGVGKSSIINALVPGAAAVVNALSEATEEGTHTTTAAVMHPLPGGGRIVDTPGVREFLPLLDDPQTVQSGFPEVEARAGLCRFTDCLHLREPDCAVKAAWERGAIDARRYESYKRLVRAAQSRQAATPAKR